VGDGMERRTLRDCRNKTPLYNYFKGIHSFKPHKLKLVTLDHPQELFAVLNEIEDAYAGYEFA
jgi:hypothetical protein